MKKGVMETDDDSYISGLYSWLNGEPFTVMGNSGRVSVREEDQETWFSPCLL